MKVLLIEDSLEDRDWAEKALNFQQKNLVQITNASTMNDGIQAADKEHFDLVILDLHLSGMYDFETYQFFQRACPSAPVMVWSRSADTRSSVYIVRAGAVWALGKPPRLLEECEALEMEHFRHCIFLAVANHDSTQRLMTSLSTVPDMINALREDMADIKKIAEKVPMIEMIQTEDHKIICELRDTIIKAAGNANSAVPHKWDFLGKFITGLFALLGLIAASWANWRWK